MSGKVYMNRMYLHMRKYKLKTLANIRNKEDGVKWRM
jgi:hypothetical protein